MKAEFARQVGPNIQVIVATFNRRDVTLRALAALFKCELPSGARLHVSLGDASSPDGTAAAVNDAFPEVHVVSVPQSWYWAQTMRYVWTQVASRDYDYIVWLNDDVLLDPDALVRLLQVSQNASGCAIVAGATRSGISQEVTYSAYRSTSKVFPLRLQRVLPGDRAVKCDTVNGNLVLIPRLADTALGGFPNGYTHSLADMALGFMARRRRIECLLAPGTIGTCERNSTQGTWQDRSLDARQRWRLLRSPKGLPWQQWSRYCLVFGGPTGALIAIKPYLSVSLGVVREWLLRWRRLA